MSLYGITGTLKEADFYKGLYGNFLGKTGTLDKVRAVSGYLITPDGLLYISIIGNNIENNNTLIYRLMNNIVKNNC